MATEAEKIKQAITNAESDKAKVGSSAWTLQLMGLNQLLATGESVEDIDPWIASTMNRFDTTKETVLLGVQSVKAMADQVSVAEQIELVTTETPTSEITRLLEAIHILTVTNPIERQRLTDRLILRAKLKAKSVNAAMAEIDRKFRASGQEILDQIAEPTESTSAPKFRDALPDMPADMAQGVVVPAGYVQRKDGRVVRTTAEGDSIDVSSSPVMLTRRLRDVDEETVQLELAFRRHGQWRTLIQPRRTFLDTRAILKCADYDLPVSSDNAVEMVRFVARMDQANDMADRVTSVDCVASLGWRTLESGRAFALGSTVMSDQETRLLVAPTDPGEQQTLKAFVEGGTWEDWIDLFRSVQPFPRMRMAVYGSLASPLLTLIGAPGYALHFCGNTTKGKTTALQLAASVWGYPGGYQLSQRHGLIGGWEGTAVANERRFGFFRHLPVFLDDSHLVPLDVASKTAYWAVNGSGRRRGDKSATGTRATSEWHLALLSTGERTLGETTANAGVQVRAIDLWGDVLDSDDPQFQTTKSRALTAMNIRSQVGMIYGHAGRRFIEALLKSDPVELTSQYQEVREALVNEVGFENLGDMGNRLVEAFGAIALAGEIFHRECGAGTSMAEVTADQIRKFIADEIRKLLKENPIQHADESAYDQVMSWAAMNASSFIGSPSKLDKPPFGGWLGAWDVETGGYANCIVFAPAPLKAFLQNQGHSYTSVIRGWKERKMLVPGDSNHNERKVYELKDLFPEASSARFVVLRREAPAEPHF